MSITQKNKLFTQKIKFEKFEILCSQDNILKIVYLEGTIIDLELVLQLKEIVESIILQGNIFFLIDASFAKGVTREAYQYLQNFEEYHRVGGFAILTASPTARIMGIFSIKLYPVRYPKKLFSKEEEAIKWLKNLM